MTRTLQALLCLLLFVSLIPACSSRTVPRPTSSGSYQNEHPTQRPYVVKNQSYYPMSASHGFEESGIASWYGSKFHGRKTSNGESYNMYAMTAAHKTLPMNTMLLVKNLDNGREVVVRVNDRGPFVRGRIIDLSYSAAKKMDMIRRGTARVHITTLSNGRQSQAQVADMAKKFYYGEYYVQIGSFSKRTNALRLQDRFDQAGYSTAIQNYYGVDTTYYRVHVYVGKTLKEALLARDSLENRGYKNAFVIAR